MPDARYKPVTKTEEWRRDAIREADVLVVGLGWGLDGWGVGKYGGVEVLVREHDGTKYKMLRDAPVSIAAWFKLLDEHNAEAAMDNRPLVDAAPLPAGAQFLNVIESVFSGMARAIIHNSNYPSLDGAKAAIDRYFAERNLQFQRNPKRAGNKIWGKERELATFSEANNCKDPRYR
jgi:hypothetical protein